MNVGLFGGSFSPPHNGHVRLAKLFRDAVCLDVLYVMPAGIAPHKAADAFGTPQARLAMTRLAFGDFASVSDFEIRQEGKSYTYKTLRHLCTLYPGAGIYLLMGEDMFLTLDTWKRAEEIFSLATIVCMRRTEGANTALQDTAARFTSAYGARVLYLPEEPFVVSSSKVRALCAAGASIAHLVPASVENYIKEHRLYCYDKRDHK